MPNNTQDGMQQVVSDHQRDWAKNLYIFTTPYRSSLHEWTGETPACIMIVWEIRLPCDLEFGCKPGEEIAGKEYVNSLKGRLHYIHERVRQNLQMASDRKTRYYIKASEGDFNAGDFVWLYNPQRKQGLSPKLQRDWEGPYNVIQRIKEVVYRIQKLPRGKRRVLHVNRLAMYEAEYDIQEDTRIRRATSEEMDHEDISFETFMSYYVVLATV